MCNAHRKWEAKATFEQDGHPWAGEMIRFLDKVKRATDIARGLGRERLPPRLLAKFERWFDRIVAGGEKYCDDLPAFEPGEGRQVPSEETWRRGKFPAWREEEEEGAAAVLV